MNVPVNYGAVAVAALAGYLLGGLWYGPLFGNAWRKLSKAGEARPTPAVIVIGLAGSLIMSYMLAYALLYANAYHRTSGISSGLIAGCLTWLGFIAPVTVGSVIYENRSWSLWVLNNGYWLASLLVMGAILAAWT